MKGSTKEATTRRGFLVGGIGSVFAVSCFGVFGSRALSAEAQKGGKPGLSPEAFTVMLASGEDRRRIKLDLVDYVSTHFDLSPGQLENFKKVPREDLKNFYEALGRAEEQGVKITMRTEMSRASCGDGRGFRMRTSFDSNGLTIVSYRK